MDPERIHVYTAAMAQHDVRFLPEYKKYDLRTSADPGFWYRPTMGLQVLEKLRFPWFRRQSKELKPWCGPRA